MGSKLLRSFNLLMAIGAISAPAIAAPPRQVKPVGGNAAPFELGSVVPSHRVAVDSVRELPDEFPFQRYVIGQGLVEGNTAGEPTGIEIYRNTLGGFFWPATAPGTRMADDVRTICAGSNVTYLAVMVGGGGDGTGPGFSIDLELFTRCPNDAQDPGVPIPGSQHHVEFDNDGFFLVEFIPDTPLPVSGGFWVAITFAQEGAGWVYGSPAEIGNSDDVFDGPFGCITFFGGCPPNPCASFFVDVYGDSCLEVYRAYEASAFSGFYAGMEATERFADEMLPISAPGLCDLAQYDVGLASEFGAYNMALEIWDDDETNMRPGAPVLGTARNFLGLGNGFLELASFELTPIAHVPTARMWMTYDVSGPVAGPILVAEFPEVGFSDDCFSIFDNPDPDVWSGCIWWYGGCPGAPCATFQNRLFCAGTEPAGSCCDVVTPDADDCLNDVPTTQCTGRFVPDGLCETDPYDPPCGTAACCTTDGDCSNMLQGACDGVGGLWQAGDFCGVDDHQCPNAACITAPNDCFTETLDNPGCNNATCCSIVCNIDGFCCDIAWDKNCVQHAGDFCPLPAPDTCSDAVVLECGGSRIIDNTLGTTTGDEPGYSCHNMGGGEQGVGAVWAKFVATESTARINTCDSESPADDSLLAVYTGICGNLTEVNCSDDVDGCHSGTGFNSEICLEGLSIGTTYYVQVAAWTEADRGRYNVELQCPQPKECGPLPPPINDPCSGAINVMDGEVNFTNTSATLDGPALPQSCNEGFGLGLAADVWFRYTAPVSGMATVDLCPGTDLDYDSRIAVYTGCACPQTTGNTLACNDDGCGMPPEVGERSNVTFPITQGQCYLLRAGGFPGATQEGNGTMVISSTGTEGCPEGAVTFTNPVSGTVDARQPHPVNSPTPLQGIQTLTATGPVGAVDACWRMCETASVPGSPNSIQSVTDNGAGTYTIMLARPITAGAVTRVSYNPNAGASTVGAFISHPANVNGDGSASPIDVLRIIDCLNGLPPAVNCPHGIFSQDLDRSNVFGPADILRAVDLLNGADVFIPWNGTALPNAMCTP